MDVDAIRGGHAVWDADLLSCDFVDHTCAWMAGSSWQRNATDVGWNLQAISPSNGVATLESFQFVATAVETNLVLSFWIGGSGARLEVQRKTVASNWTSLAMLVESSSQPWRRVVVETGDGSATSVGGCALTTGSRPSGLPCRICSSCQPGKRELQLRDRLLLVVHQKPIPLVSA